MMKVLCFLLTLTTFNFAFAQHGEHALTNAKIAHDASHRVGKLVDTGKIDEFFIKDMRSIEIKNLPHNLPTDPAYSVLVSAGATAQTLLTFDMKGKFLSNKIINQDPSEETQWETYASELLEAALHFVTEVSNPNIDMSPFVKTLGVATLKQQKSEDGAVQPVVILSSTASEKLLQVVLSQKGEIVSYSLVE